MARLSILVVPASPYIPTGCKRDRGLKCMIRPGCFASEFGEKGGTRRRDLQLPYQGYAYILLLSLSVTFSTETRAAYPSMAKKFDDFERLARDCETRIYRRIRRPDSLSTSALISSNSCHLMQTALIRCRLLVATIIACINEQTGPGLYLAARALFETTGLVACLLLHLRRYYAKEESYDEFEQMLRRLSLGQRWEPLRDARGESLRPVNALTLVESIATLLAEILGDPGAKDHTMASYEVLSEYCHPNRAGRRAGVRFSTDKLEVTYEIAPRFSAEDIAATLPAAGTVVVALLAAYEESLRLLSTHEEMPTLER